MRFHHSHIKIKDLDQTRAFFCDALDFSELRCDRIEEHGLSILYLTAPGDQGADAPCLELACYDGDDAISDGSRFAHIGLAVDSVDKECERLSALGVTILLPPQDGQYAYIQSPDGLVIELIADPA